MRGINLANTTLMTLVASCFIQIGAQLFAVSIIASTVAQAPPRSFAIFQGDYGYDSSSFWNVVPNITLVLFLIASIANWRTPRRSLVLTAFGLFLAAGLAAVLLLDPTFDGMIARGYSDTVDPVLQNEAARWLKLDWMVWGTSLAAGFLLLLAIVRPVDSK